jgi:hypothetical protein
VEKEQIDKEIFTAYLNVVLTPNISKPTAELYQEA